VIPREGVESEDHEVALVLELRLPVIPREGVESVDKVVVIHGYEERGDPERGS
jgi:hypothetical protein